MGLIFGKVKAPHIIWLTFRGLIARKLQGGGASDAPPPPTETGLIKDDILIVMT